MSDFPDHIKIFQSLFKGRSDVFAIRWEKEGKSGYMPAYNLDWNEYNAHKAKGGTFQNFKNKSYKSLAENHIQEHLNGKQTIGIYPLLQDNTSWFIAADFDEKNWLEDCRTFLETCNKYEIPAYLERSRSGNGGHIWIFFEENYPAIKSRAIVKNLLTHVNINVNTKTSFDRLFPNQDSHSGLGLGNLIALPLQGNSLQNGNSCFIDINGSIIPNQWGYLKAIRKISSKRLDELFYNLYETASAINSGEIKGLQIKLSNQLILNRNGITEPLLKFIKEQLYFTNQEFLVKKKFNRNTYKAEASFKLYSETDSEVFLLRGFTGKLIRFCKEQNLPFELKDFRENTSVTHYKSLIKLREYQKEAIEITNKKDFGVIVAPPGSGKTVIGLEIISRKQQSALIIVHRQQLLEQWLERIESFLGISSNEVGLITGSTKTIGKQITIAMIQSLGNLDVQQKFGVVIVDECHHAPAKTFRTAIEKIHSYYLYGLTATPKRKYNDEILIYSYIGEIIAQITPDNSDSITDNKPSIIIRETKFLIPFNSSTDNAELLLISLMNDTQRNQMIVQDVINEVRNGKQVLILTERKSHIQLLAQYLKTDFELVCISGEDSRREREHKLKQIQEEDFQILISTGQFLGEGADIPSLDCLFLVFPFSFEGKLIQYIGRVQRGDNEVRVYDYRDKNIEYLDRQFKQRNKYYNSLRPIETIADGSEMIVSFDKTDVYIQNNINILQLFQLDLLEDIAGFVSGTCWRIRVIKYNSKVKSMLVEVLDYNATNDVKEADERYYAIERVVFKSIDSAQLKKCILKNTGLPSHAVGSSKKYFEVNVLFDEIHFDYGYVYFNTHIIQISKTVKVRIDNDFIRPEFEIVREYFKKVLRFKTILVNVEIEYKNNQIVSCIGMSKEIDRMNASVIDTVKFEYLNQNIKSGKDPLKFSILSSDDISKDLNTLFSNEEELLNILLENKQPKHYKQLKYLSKKHCYKLVRLRFIIEPFSFLFLLEGNTHYHILWETLDTEEATYLWHISKEENLREEISRIDLLISQALQEGKFYFLESKPERFSRIYHDYSDLNKGFMGWKDMLQKYLV